MGCREKLSESPAVFTSKGDLRLELLQLPIRRIAPLDDSAGNRFPIGERRAPVCFLSPGRTLRGDALLNTFVFRKKGSVVRAVSLQQATCAL